MSRFFDDSIEIINKGREGVGIWIPTPWKKLSQYIGNAPGMQHYVGGDSGSGKSAFVVQGYVIHLYEWIKEHPELEINLSILAYLMERPVAQTKLKWISAMLWRDYRILTDVFTLARWGYKRSRLPDEVYEKIIEVTEKLEDISNYVQIRGKKDPKTFNEEVKQVFRERGRVIEVPATIGPPIKKYVANNPKDFVVIVADHLGLFVPSGANQSDRKMYMDEAAGYLQGFRDNFNSMNVIVNQFNRGKDDAYRRTKLGVKPNPSDFDGTSKPYHDSDVVIGMIDPTNYDLEDYFGYNIKSMINERGVCRFRSATLMKNSYGQDNLTLGLPFLGEIGWYYQMPRAKDMTPEAYRKVASLGNDAVWSLYDAEKPSSNTPSYTLLADS